MVQTVHGTFLFQSGTLRSRAAWGMVLLQVLGTGTDNASLLPAS